MLLEWGVPKRSIPLALKWFKPPRCILHVKHFKSFFFVFQKRLSSIKGTFSYSHVNLLSFKRAYCYYCMGKGRSPLIFGAYTLGAYFPTLKLGEGLEALGACLTPCKT